MWRAVEEEKTPATGTKEPLRGMIVKARAEERAAKTTREVFMVLLASCGIPMVEADRKHVRVPRHRHD